MGKIDNVTPRNCGRMSELDVRLFDDGQKKSRATWMLLQPFYYLTKDGDRLKVPQGFVTDFASVPRIILAWEIAGGRANWESMLHDYLLATTYKAYADEIFLEAMESDKEPKVRRTLMYWAVKFFGRKK